MSRSSLFEGVDQLTDEQKEKRLFNYFIHRHYVDKIRDNERFNAPQIGKLFGISKEHAQFVVYCALKKLRNNNSALLLWLTMRRGVAL